MLLPYREEGWEKGLTISSSETTSIPTNPRTTRPVGYAFVDVSTSSEAERAIAQLNGQTILDRKVSVQLAKKPEPAGEKAEGGEGQARRRSSTRGRSGRGRGGRNARARGVGSPNLGGEKDSEKDSELTNTQKKVNGTDAVNGENVEPATNGAPTNVPGQANTLTSTTNEALTAEPGTEGTMNIDAKKNSGTNARVPRKQRGPPEDGVPSKTKIMVANLPYDLREEKASHPRRYT